MAQFRVIYRGATAACVTGTDTYSTVTDALNQMRRLCSNLPAPFNDPANHPGFVDFMQMKRDKFGVADLDNPSSQFVGLERVA